MIIKQIFENIVDFAPGVFWDRLDYPYTPSVLQVLQLLNQLYEPSFCLYLVIIIIMSELGQIFFFSVPASGKCDFKMP